MCSNFTDQEKLARFDAIQAELSEMHKGSRFLIAFIEDNPWIHKHLNWIVSVLMDTGMRSVQAYADKRKEYKPNA